MTCHFNLNLIPEICSEMNFSVRGAGVSTDQAGVRLMMIVRSVRWTICMSAESLVRPVQEMTQSDREAIGLEPSRYGE